MLPYICLMDLSDYYLIQRFCGTVTFYFVFLAKERVFGMLRLNSNVVSGREIQSTKQEEGEGTACGLVCLSAHSCV